MRCIEVLFPNFDEKILKISKMEEGVIISNSFGFFSRVFANERTSLFPFFLIPFPALLMSGVKIATNKIHISEGQNKVSNQ